MPYRGFNMNVLFLTQILPYPPNAGPRVKTWHVLRHLAHRGFQITLVTFIRPEEEEFLDEVRKTVYRVIHVPIQRSRIKDAGYFAQSIFTGKPFLVARDNLVSMRNTIHDLCTNQDFDILHADQLTMAQFAWQARQIQIQKGSSAPKTIFDAHNATWSIMGRMRTQVPTFLRPLVVFEQVRIKKYEGWLLHNFDLTLAVTEIDRNALLETVANDAAIKHKITTIPIAVDTQQLAPVAEKPGASQILTLGTLHYPPNADGIRWFLREVYPRILQQVPSAFLTVIGKNPPKDFYDMAQLYPNLVEITGYVADLTPYLENCAVMVVPVLAGGGMRVRILEAFSRQLAVVTTTIGLEGIDAKHGEHVLIADDPLSFAGHVARLLEDQPYRAALAKNGRLFVENQYDWQVVFKHLDQAYTIGNGNNVT